MPTELERRETRFHELRDMLAEKRQRIEELDEEIAAKLAEGLEPNGLREERRESRELVRDLAGALPVIRERLREDKLAALREEAEGRLQSIKKAAGGLAGETPRREEKARELLHKLVAQLNWLYSVSDRRRLLETEAGLLAAAFDLEVPELKDVPGTPGRTARDLRQRLEREV